MSHSIVHDNFGRRIRKLRVSLLDACNFRCFYCMPKDAKFVSSSQYLQPEELHQICKGLIPFGIEEVRITGGEPTIRNDFSTIMEMIGTLSLRKLGLTTNGVYLKKYLPLLKKVNCNYINVSLDSLIEKRFNEITYSKNFTKTLDSILEAKDMGFAVKVNTVLFRGVNDDEINNFITFSEMNNIEVRFLEMMKIGMANNSQNRMFISAGEALESIKEKRTLHPVLVEKDSTSFNFTTDKGGKVGFIASESQPFCGNCSRLRLTYDGKLRACLFSEKGENIRHVPVKHYGEVVNRVFMMKPTDRIEEIPQNMYQIGG